MKKNNVNNFRANTFIFRFNFPGLNYKRNAKHILRRLHLWQRAREAMF